MLNVKYEGSLKLVPFGKNVLMPNVISAYKPFFIMFEYAYSPVAESLSMTELTV